MLYRGLYCPLCYAEWSVDRLVDGPTMSNQTLAIVVAVLLAISLTISTNSPARGHELPISIPNVPLPSSAYVTMYQIQNNSADASPWILYPASNKTVLVVTIKLGHVIQSQIVNFTMGVSPKPIGGPLNNTIPTDIVYDHFAKNNAKRVWIIENDSLAYYNQAAGKFEPAVSFPGGAPQYMTIDPSDHFWITLFNTDQIVEYNPSRENSSSYRTPTPNAGLQGIAVSPVDNSTWFAEAYAGKIGHLTCDASACTIMEYGPPSGLRLQGVIQVAVDKNGIVWFTIHNGNEFGSFNPSTGDWKLFPIGYCSDSYVADCWVGLPNAISLDSEGRVWFSEHYAGRIAMYDPNRDILVEYMMPTASAVCRSACTPYAWWMWPGEDEKVWFTAFGLGEIGYVNASLPIPFNVISPSHIVISQAGCASIVVSSAYETGLPPSFDGTATSEDALSNPPSVTFSGPELYHTSNRVATSILTIFAGRNATTGARYVAVTAYNENVTVNAFVRVDVVSFTAHLWTCITSLGLYTTVGFASGISGVTIIGLMVNFYSQRKKNISAPQNPKVRELGATRVLSQ